MCRLLATVFAGLLAQAAFAQAQPYRIAVGTFLSGPASGPFGVPARNRAELLAEQLNAGNAPAPYAAKGFGGRPLELHFVDEAGRATKQVEQFGCWSSSTSTTPRSATFRAAIASRSLRWRRN